MGKSGDVPWRVCRAPMLDWEAEGRPKVKIKFKKRKKENLTKHVLEA